MKQVDWSCITLNRLNYSCCNGKFFTSGKEKQFFYVCCATNWRNVEKLRSIFDLLITALVPEHFLPILLCFFVCSICAVGPSGKGKWDHNLNVSVLKTMPAECYSLTAFMAMLHSLSDHRCEWVALGRFESPSGPV